MLFFRFHMVNDYMHLWHLITLLFRHLMSCKASDAGKNDLIFSCACILRKSHLRNMHL